MEQQVVDIDTFAEELKLLQRIIYKNKNQHRRTKYFQTMQMAQRSLSKVAVERAHLKQLRDAHERLRLVGDPSAFQAFVKEIDMILSESISTASLVEKARARCVVAAEKISGVVAHGRFLPFAVVSLATMSRFEGLLRTLLVDLLKAFDDVCLALLRRGRSILFKEKDRGQMMLDVLHSINRANFKLAPDARKLYVEWLEATKDLKTQDEDVGEAIPVPVLKRDAKSELRRVVEPGHQQPSKKLRPTIN